MERVPSMWGCRGVGIALLLGFAVIPACVPPPGPEAGDVTQLVKTAGDNQTVLPGTTVPLRPSVKALDADGNPVPDVSIEFSVLSGGGSVTGTNQTTDGDGVATIESWTVGSIIGQQTLQAAVPTTDISTTFTANVVAADAKLGIRTQPGGAASGADLAPQPVIEIQNAAGQVVTASTAPVTVAIASGNGAFTGAAPLTVNAQAGVATFAGLKINGSGAHTLRFTSGTLTAVVSASFNVVGAPATLALGSQLEVLAKGATRTLAATVKDGTGATLPNASVTYTSRSAAIATVSATGVITAVAKGQAVVVANVTGQAGVADSALVVVAETNGTALISGLDRFSLKSDTTFTVSIFVDMLASTKKLASFAVDVAWNKNQLTYQSHAAGASFSPTVNASTAANGTLKLAHADVNGFTGRVELLRITFKAATTTAVTGSLALTATELNDSDYANLLALAVLVSHPLVIR